MDAVEFVGPMTMRNSASSAWPATTTSPGFWEPGARGLHLMVNKAAFDAPADLLQKIRHRNRLQQRDSEMLARYDHLNPIALRRPGRRRRAAAGFLAA